MFGHVRINAAVLTEEERNRYRAWYCGLCRALGERYGLPGRMALTYDMTFLCIFLSSLYEPETEEGMLRCLPHPGKPHAYLRNEISDYAADMTVALTYHKCMDDWLDEHKHTRKAYADLLARSYAKVEERWPRQTGEIRRALQELTEVERRRDESPDAAAGCFGQLMSAVFMMKDDYWRGALRSFGSSLGRFIYLADAACDYDEDKKTGNYNPVILLGCEPENMRDALVQTLGAASRAFEALPMVEDEHILKNILYSGLWQSYNEAMQKRKEVEAHGR